MEYNGEQFIERIMKKANCKKKNELAEKLKVDKSYISKWIKAKSYPNIDTLIHIASTLNCSVDFLLGIEKKEISPYSDIRDVIKELFLYDYFHYLGTTQSHIDTGNISFEYYGIKTNGDTITFNYSTFDNMYLNAQRKKNTAIKELLEKLSAISQLYNTLEQDQIILLIDNEIKKNKEKYSAIEYV